MVQREGPKAWENLRVDLATLELGDRSAQGRLSAKPLGASRPWWPPDAQAFCLEAERAEEVGDLDHADRELGRALDLLPAEPWLHSWRGRLALRRDRLEDARREFLHAIEVDQELPAAQVGLAVACARLGYAAEARTAARRALDLHPGDPDARKLNRSLAGESREEPRELRGALDTPLAGAQVTGPLFVAGWVLADGDAEPEIDLWIDGRPLDTHLRRQPRPDVTQIFPALSPMNPTPGFFAYLEVSDLSPGSHTLSCAVRAGRRILVLATRVFTTGPAEIEMPKR
jgi:tetratricopeptide (TPR) repeat protein